MRISDWSSDVCSSDLEPFFRGLAPCRVGLEACPGAHYWGRLLRTIGHDVQLLPAQFVRPYVKSNKNDAADAEAICEAMTRPTMRFVPIKSVQQQAARKRAVKGKRGSDSVDIVG